MWGWVFSVHAEDFGAQWDQVCFPKTPVRGRVRTQRQLGVTEARCRLASCGRTLSSDCPACLRATEGAQCDRVLGDRAGAGSGRELPEFSLAPPHQPPSRSDSRNK